MAAQTSQQNRALLGFNECDRADVDARLCTARVRAGRSATVVERLVRMLVVGALAAGLLYWPMSADALPRTPWPADRQVRIYNPTDWQSTMRAAAEAWNRTEVTPTIVFSSRYSDADVVVEASTWKLDQRCDEDYRCEAYAAPSRGLRSISGRSRAALGA